MPFFQGFSRAIPVATLFVSVVTSQTCYYPDKLTISTDVPCTSNGAPSACCSADDFCLDNGLCYGNGIVSRGSCTDQTWGSAACAGYCQTESPNTGIAITPCSDSLFVCGLNTTDCQTDSRTFSISGGGITLRPSQVAQVVSSGAPPPPPPSGSPPPGAGVTVTATATATVTPSGSSSSCPLSSTADGYSSGALAGVGCGVGLPLFLALCGAILLLRREKQRNDLARTRQMYDEPDESDNTGLKPRPLLRHQTSFAPSFTTTGPSIAGSRRGSLTAIETPAAKMPAKWIARYGSAVKRPEAQELDLGIPRHELDTAPPYDQPPDRHELSKGVPSSDWLLHWLKG